MTARAATFPGVRLALLIVAVVGLALGAAPAQGTILFEPGASPEFRARVQGCLHDIERAGARGRRFIRKALAPVQVTIVPSRGVTWTLGTPPDLPQRVHWDPHQTGEYGDGAAKLSCAILLHELTHAYENFIDLRSGEFGPVQNENWFIWRWGKLTHRLYYQRFYYIYVERGFPRTVNWPQPPAPPPPGPKRLPPSAGD